MKKIYLYLPVLFICLLACQKEELVSGEQQRAVKLELKGAILVDTLEFLIGDKVMGQAFNTSFMPVQLYAPGEKIRMRRKSDQKQVGEFEVLPAPFVQVKKIFYDGVTATDNLELTPVSDARNMGVRMRFSVPLQGVETGAVDLEVTLRYINWDTFEFTYTPYKTFRNITGSFGDFVELPPLASESEAYIFKVYKAGTRELPYNNLDRVELSDPDNNYGELATYYNFVAGDTRLLSITPYTGFNGTRDVVTDGYSIEDFSYAFK